MTYNKPINKPTPYDTQIWLCKSEIDITSGHQVFFETVKEKTDYFTSPVRSIALPNNRYIKNKSGELTLDLKMVDVEGKYNFLIYLNPHHENKYIICNIIDYQYTNDRVSRIFYAVDSWLTYQHDLDLSKESFIARRHFTSGESETIKNLPYEDLDRGKHSVLASESVHQISGGESFFVITLSNPIVKEFDRNYRPLRNLNTDYTYIDEMNKTVEITHDARIPESAIIFIVNEKALTDLIENVFNTPEHVNKLQKITYVPFNISLMALSTTNYFTDATGRSTNGTHKLYLATPSTFSKQYRYRPFESAKHMIKKSVHGDFTQLTPEATKPIKIWQLSGIEQYFMRTPFTSFQLADGMGNVTEHDYAEIQSDLDDYVDLRIFGTLGIIPSIAYNIGKRDKYGFNQALSRHQGLKFEKSFALASDLETQYIVPSETITIINDYLSAFLQSNQNQISQQKANVNTSFEMSINNINADAQRQLSGANLQFNNGNLQRENDLTNYNVKQAVDQSNNTLGMVGQGFNLISSAVGNIASGNIGGAIGGAVGGGVNMALQNRQFGNTMSANNEMFNNSMASSIEISQNNLSHQQSIINSSKAQNLRNTSINSKMTLDTMNARMLDVKNRPDSISSMHGGTMMNVLYNRYNIFMRTYITHPHSINRTANYLSEYGMLANTKESIERILTRFTYGTYIQTVNANIHGNIPQSALNEIKLQFNNGVFIWKDIEKYRQTELMKKT